MTDMIFYTEFYTGAATAQDFTLEKEVLKNETRW